MAITAIRPGEHLTEELKELGMSASELARQLDVPPNRVTEILHGQGGDHWRNRAAPWPFLWYDGGILVESAKWDFGCNDNGPRSIKNR